MTATIVHLSGPRRGTTWQLAGGLTRLVESQFGLLPFAGEVNPGDGAVLLTFHQDGDGYRVEAPEGTRLWVNGERVNDRGLQSGDLIEAGDAGPILRYRSPGKAGSYKTVREAMGDCVDTARYGGKNWLDRIGVLVLGPPYEMATQIAPLARLSMLVVLLVLVGSVAALWQRNTRLQSDLDAQIQRLEGLTAMLEGSESSTFTRADFDDVRSELDFRIDDTLARVQALEARASARGRVISEASAGVMFLQGAYGFLEPTSGEPLRLIEGAPPGTMALTLTGDGAPLELRYTGTGFVTADSGLVVTNRHVAVPWEFDDNAQRLIAQGFEPQMRRFVGYLPGITEPFEVRTLRTDPDADLAVLQPDVDLQIAPGLRLAESPPQIGDEVIVLGYPMGMRALLARADADFVDEIMDNGSIGFFELAELLAGRGIIEPLATVGVIGQTSSGSITYDAETTHGGSGGPVLTLAGEVVAVNAAILSEFGGSNLGVPTALVRPLLEAAAARNR